MIYTYIYIYTHVIICIITIIIIITCMFTIIILSFIVLYEYICIMQYTYMYLYCIIIIHLYYTGVQEIVALLRASICPDAGSPLHWLSLSLYIYTYVCNVM